ncbi:ribonuclease P protein component [Aquimarina algicola]|uniref:Ribonuclease P protein component n=1 Tax=Aquimarina algicola TaxID=2589995 RepID=A0A504JM05_9FLAO|nr:ribonuclease P protein component [Aquimarina algicola]TPN87829.1 ribonuclease P protein component [Aquimarina algicola]
MKATFNKKEKLKSRKEIGNLFSEGKAVSKYPIKLIYKKTTFEENVTIKAGVSVSKRNFKKAVDRNHIKRLMRESYRKNKYIVINTTHQYTFMFLYLGKEIPEYTFMEHKFKALLQKFVEQEIK